MSRDHVVHIATDAPAPVASGVPYKFQPIVRIGSNTVFGYEILYRGPKVIDWNDVDRMILSYLSSAARGLPTLFVNLSNEAFLQAPIEQLLTAATKNDVYFELSESIPSLELFDAIAAKVNRLTDLGVRFAVDDFGAGHDGLGRTFALQSIAVVKVDGAMLHQAMLHKKNADMLQRVVAQWKQDGTVTVAECIETADMLSFATQLDFDLVQGWHVDDLVPAFDLTDPARRRGG
ncbi:EAL domain-containing protein [Noviherbaspirillum pedocola]|uniref:EAL domain-containing protein n=1 Tax=Noviherbaspirillum pedocola TaxID=2801341 RepID=A0A934T028_9BURK|nr:EAL domain-containing protein [Noviherbaspirillum pedocola]MBK4735944.1 EAL domain-containing protein [Noviherbaspirillum pedocola]